MKLYHYVHCPYCIRVRMGLGLLKIQFESKVLAYNDEKTPINLTGVKMLPIIEDSTGIAMNESLDILKKFDPNDLMNWNLLKAQNSEIEDLLNKVAGPVHSLCMPYWIWTPEFDSISRKYFQDKKEVKRGPFKNLIHNKDSYINTLNQILQNEIEPNLKPFYKNSSISILDIMLAAHLWGMYIFPEFQFSEKIHNYLQTIRSNTNFNYHQDFWN